MEHIIAFLLLSPFLLRDIKIIRTISRNAWINLIALAAISSVAGTIFFTQALAKSFAQKDYITPLMLLKLQPIFAVALSWIFLKEKLTLKFVLCLIAAVIGSYLISFGFLPISFSLEGKTLVFILSLCAPLCWGAGTILSKNLLNKTHYLTATGLRYFVGIPCAVIAAYLLGQTYDFRLLGIAQWWRFFTIAGITGGVLALIIYYKGLQKTEAKVSSIAELVFPLISIVIGTTSLNPYGAPQQLSIAQIIGIFILLAAMSFVTMSERSNTLLTTKSNM